jgi:ComF family protein
LRKLEADFTAPRLFHTWFDRARSLFPFQGLLREALHGFKYEQRFDLTRFFVSHLEGEAIAMGPFDIIVPVPLHPKRLRERGFNQAALIAHPLAKKLRCKYDVDVLVRTEEVGPQVGRELKDRLKAVKGIFIVADHRKVKDKRVLLIDDVLTTGATANECARVLKKAGASRVDVLTIARTI